MEIGVPTTVLAVQAGVTGTNLDLSNLDRQGAAHPDQLEWDYRTVFGSVLQDWLGASDTSLGATFPLVPMDQKAPIINNNAIVDSQCYWVPAVQNITWNVGAKVFLQGYYSEAAGEMRTDLITGSLVPTSQPYTAAPFNYQGNESTATFPTDTVDWVLVELRDGTNLDTILATKAVLLRKDGMIMEPDGTMGINFLNIPAGFYHLAVYHRSHLAVLSASSISTTQTTPFVDLTTSANSAMGTGQLIDMSGAFALHVGDYDSNGILNNQDFNNWKQNPAALDAYMPTDGDGNGIINNQDFNLWKSNGSKIGEQTIRK